MKLLSTLIALLVITISTTVISHAQIVYGNPIDSTIYTFNTLDTSFDTAGAHAWQIGTTNKPYFSAGGFTQRSIMTDTANSYPINANSGFVYKFTITLNGPIISITHKYQTTAQHDGGIIEFSTDNGYSWQNVVGPCSVGFSNALRTENFYAPSDTLYNGEAGFSGNSNGWITTRLQFFYAIPLKPTAGSGCNYPNVGAHVQLRFRFVSDDIAENLDGWIINSMEARADNYGSSVAKLNKDGSLPIYPNPSADGIFKFPAIDNEKGYTISICDIVGHEVLHSIYNESINLSSQTSGLYFYKISNGSNTYTGKLIIQ
ncbi:MAG: T9SS type A sorting domain-containing protein [Bacteroidota bacterium]